MSSSGSGRSTQEWQRLDAAHYLHPFTDHKQLAGAGARIITHAEGVYIYTSDGQKILDGMAGLWCVAIGYGRRELAEAAYRQMLELPYYNNFFQCSTPPAIEPLRERACAASGHSMVTALRARVSTRR